MQPITIRHKCQACGLIINTEHVTNLQVEITNDSAIVNGEDRDGTHIEHDMCCLENCPKCYAYESVSIIVIQ